ncbi:hypothetical protein KP509_31G009900 [Ceratopteris richardii]|uniref:Thiamine pyrimidine synthase n=1 Tax=Ceratopteris richardii TaxID=49495 RepID=A0A8T2QX45_CERRI|nr:hypothetical protein KP509_31G009900 [Ceratopteris richardii]
MAEVKDNVVVALDWTPNSNHVGFFVAQALGFYRDAGLLVSFISPEAENYSVTPASRLANGSALFALGPSETVISHHLPPVGPSRPKLIAIATILQHDLSAIATLKTSGIQRPCDLDGRKYASYGARFEGRIVQKLIQCDGGKGHFSEVIPDKLEIWDTLLSGKADATWIFKSWEGVDARLKEIELNDFSLSDFGIPYGYSPVLICCPDTLKKKPEMVRTFLECTGKGFVYASTNIEHASKILMDAINDESSRMHNNLDPHLVLESLKYMANDFLDHSRKWGVMERNRWKSFIEWLSSQDLLTSLIQSRNPIPGVSASLDDLRSGDAGFILRAADLDLDEMFTNAYL